MNTDLFKSLINKTEGPTLDFKSKQYPLIGDKNDIETAKFVKDIISFANTKREESAYIIIGISDDKVLCGLDHEIDEATLQSKLRDKVHPIPKFSYSNFEFEGTVFGIFEIPIARYSIPITPAIKLKGLSPGVVYFRRGSKNDEAKSLEVIEIHEWLKGLNSLAEPEIKNDISALIADINNKSEFFSKEISKALLLAQRLNDPDLEYLLRNELNGWVNFNGDPSVIKHREINVYVTLTPIKSIINRGVNSSVNNIWNELKDNQSFVHNNIAFGESLSEIEDILETFKSEGANSLYSRTIKGRQLLGENSEFAKRKFHMYYKPSSISNLYSKTRQLIVSAFMKHI
jgi:hypothetical protein